MHLTQLTSKEVGRTFYLVQSLVPDLDDLYFSVPIKIDPVRLQLVYAQGERAEYLFEFPDTRRHTYNRNDLEINRNLFASYPEAQEDFGRRLANLTRPVPIQEYARCVRRYNENERDLQVLQGVLDQSDTPLL